MTYNKRVSTIERHECQKISGKVHHLLLDNKNKYPSCGYCLELILWTQIADKFQHLNK